MSIPNPKDFVLFSRDLAMKRPAAVERQGNAKAAKTSPRSGPLRRPAAAPVKRETHLPVTSICGFLGAGKTTLLKHILESKHIEDDEFRCAVIVNDMAALNIDKTLIDQTSVIQSDEVIAMQNGCICCTLQSDLVDQIIGLAKKKCFDYMIIEASGVSEPSQIAQLFADCENHEDTPGHEHVLNDVARLDTCVTVVDCGDFLNNLTTVKEGPKKESFPQLLVEQIEYANVIILNKTDLVNQKQLQDIKDQVSILNPEAQMLTSQNSKIDVKQVVNTCLYKADDFKKTVQKIAQNEKVEEVWEKPCCFEKKQKGQIACCVTLCKPTKKSNLDTENSQVVLSRPFAQTRHETRFGITSFVYQARRPFHPQRFEDKFVEKFFILHEKPDESQPENPGKQPSKKAIMRRQEEANKKQLVRNKEIGTLLRSKGFLWIANRHDLMGIYSHAGNVLTIECPERRNHGAHLFVAPHWHFFEISPSVCYDRYLNSSSCF